MKEIGGVKTRPGLSLSCENIRDGMVHEPYVLGKRTTLPFYEKPEQATKSLPQCDRNQI